MFEFNNYTIGENPHKLVIFLHGYNSSREDYQSAVNWFCKYIKNCRIIVPLSPEICDKNPNKRQWFGILKYDNENKRRQEQTTADEIFAIYEKASGDIAEKSAQLNNFISEIQNKFNIGDENTYLVGFSQGAMLSISTALLRTKKIAGAFSISGLVAAKNFLQQHIISQVPIYMFHGQKDMKVQYKTVYHSVEWLKKNAISVNLHTYPNLTHQITEDEVMEIAKIINKD